MERNSIPPPVEKGDIAIQPSKYGDVYIPAPDPPTPPDEKTKKLLDLAFKDPSGKSQKGWPVLPPKKV